MDEIESCNFFLNEEILILNPEVIVPLGAYATREVLSKFHADPLKIEISFAKINGKLLFLDDKKIFPLPHPAALLYNLSFEPGTIEKYKILKSFF